jgi:hypothetical protein
MGRRNGNGITLKQMGKRIMPTKGARSVFHAMLSKDAPVNTNNIK